MKKLLSQIPIAEDSPNLINLKDKDLEYDIKRLCTLTSRDRHHTYNSSKYNASKLSGTTTMQSISSSKKDNKQKKEVKQGVNSNLLTFRGYNFLKKIEPLNKEMFE